MDYRVSLGRNRPRGVPFFHGLTLLSRFTDIENKIVVTSGEGRGNRGMGEWEVQIIGCKVAMLYCVTWGI